MIINATRHTKEKLAKEYKNARKAVTGKDAGIVSKVFSSKELKDEIMEDEGSTDTSTLKELENVNYQSACLRDATYSQAGRVMVRAGGVNNKLRAVFGRAQAFVIIEGE